MGYNASDRAKPALALYEKQVRGLIEVFRGNDPEMPEIIQPIGWLHTMIQECKRIASEFPEAAGDDIDAWFEMISEVEWMYDRAKSCIQ